MVFRLMLASAATLALGAAALLAQTEPAAERVATRAEHIATHPRSATIMPAACAPAPAAAPSHAEI